MDESKENGYQTFRFQNETGEGSITAYMVFPGVMLAYNDFHMNYYDSAFQTDQDVFCIDYCREGRLEYPAGKDAFSYVEAGDLKLDRRLTHVERFEMPLSHYHGVMVAVDIPVAEQALPEEMRDFPVNIRALQQKFCPDRYPNVIHGPVSVEHIFEELYQVPEKIKTAWFKIKVLELLLYLDALELPETPREKPYFYKSQVERTKAVKQCFKSIYGVPIGTWMLQYRMNYAAERLKEDPKISISKLAGETGYDSQSKFALAFRRVMGMSPTEYRKSSDRSGLNGLYGADK